MAEQLSICMVTTFFPPTSFGGDAMHVYRLSNELARRGHSVTVVHSVDAYHLVAARGEQPRGDFPVEPGVTVVPLRARIGRAAPALTYLTGRPVHTASLRRVLGAGHDVVHFHNVSLVGGPGILRYGSGGVRLYTTNEHWLVCPMHVLWKDNREPCLEPRCLRCTLTFHRPPQLWRSTGLLDRAAGHVDLFLSPSRFTIEAHRARGFTRPMRHVPHFLPVRDAELAGPPPAAGRPYFLFVGRLERLKGVRGLVELFRRYDAADLVVAGDGELEQELRAAAAGLPHVRFTGRVHPRELPALYAGAVALIVPSAGFEVFGLVLLEAFAQSTPVIVHDLGALPEIVADSGGGLTYRTEAELLAAMERLRADHALRADLGERGRAAWLDRWSEEPHMAAYLDAIAEARTLARR
jgi:glycosyltransferase involved in cell wall biosynthesis